SKVTHAYPWIKAGTAKGAVPIQAQNRAPGKSLRSVSHASPIDSAAQIGTAMTMRQAVLIRSSATRARKINVMLVVHPVWRVIQPMKASGSNAATQMIVAANEMRGVRRSA